MVTNPTVFISYSWDSELHKNWARKLADYLIDNSVKAILDQYELEAGGNMTHFMESSVERSDKVITILTPNYKVKSENRTSGVGYKYSLISQELFEIQANNRKFIPVLREGDKETSAPGFLKSLIYHDMTKNDRFDSDAFKLLRLIFDEPEIKKPKLGFRPDFDNTSKDPILEMATAMDSQEKLEQKKKNFIESATDQAKNELRELTDSIIKKANENREKSGFFFKAQLNENILILNTKGAGISLIQRFHYYSLMDTHLEINLWDRSISFDNNPIYFPGEEPKLVESLQFLPSTNDDLELIWTNKKHTIELRTAELRELLFVKVLDEAKKKS